MTDLQIILNDLRKLTLFPRRYSCPQGRDHAYWREEGRRYSNTMKALDESWGHWRVIEFTDGHEELAYIRVLRGGLLSGMFPAIYRGPIIPHMIDYVTFSHIKRIRQAF